MSLPVVVVVEDNADIALLLQVTFSHVADVRVVGDDFDRLLDPDWWTAAHPKVVVCDLMLGPDCPTGLDLLAVAHDTTDARLVLLTATDPADVDGPDHPIGSRCDRRWPCPDRGPGHWSMTEGEAVSVSHEVILERIDMTRDLVRQTAEDMRLLSQQVGNLNALAVLAADAVPRHEKAIDALWAELRQFDAVSMADHTALAKLVERVTERLDRLESAADLDAGKQLGSREAIAQLRTKATWIAKALGIIFGGGAGIAAGAKTIDLVIAILFH